MHSFQKSTDTVIIDEFSRSTFGQRTVSNSGAAQASTSKESSTGACQKKLLGEQIGWTDDVMGRRYFCYSHLPIMMRSLAPVNSCVYALVLIKCKPHNLQRARRMALSEIGYKKVKQNTDELTLRSNGYK